MVSGYFGLPGCGKSTFLTMIARKELRRIRRGKSKYQHVLTNFYCEGCELIEYQDLGHYEIRDSLILLDEITLDADSRNFKQFDSFHKHFFLMHRHYNCDIIYFTQQYDGVDKKIRDITVNLWFIRRYGPISVAKRIWRTLDIHEQTKEIVQGYRFSNLFEILFMNPREWCWRPRWYKYFDSYCVNEGLPPYTYPIWVGEDGPPPGSAGGDQSQP